MTKGAILFGLIVGGTLGLFVPKILTAEFSIANIITAFVGAVLGFIGVAAYANWVGRI